MTPEQLKEAAAVMLAAADGKVIEVRASQSRNSWTPMVNAVWNFSVYEYRIKPEPRKVQVQLYSDGMFLRARSIEEQSYEHWKRVGDIVEIEVKE